MTSPSPLVLDVRSPAEFASGHVEGAINLPLDTFAQSIESVAPDKQQPLVLYCASGMRSAMACQYLAKLGYAQVVNGCSAGAVAQELARPVVR